VRKQITLCVFLSCIALMALFQTFAGAGEGGWLAPHRSLASGEGEALLYVPLAMHESGMTIPTRTPTPEPTGPAPAEAVLVGAGDIARCDDTNDEATADLLDDIAGIVFTTGDNAYSDGSPEEYADCYDPSWGRHKARTRPSAGNHDYRTEDAAGYFDYFGDAAGAPGEGYYSYDLDSWHIVVLNSNCLDIDGCEAGSPQEQWLRDDLAANETLCTAAYFHHPLFSSGVHGSDDDVADLWKTLYEFGADVVLNGHEHNYERFAPQDPDGNADPEAGIRQFIVGTGGTKLRDVNEPIENSEVLENETHGVLKLTLHATGYDWEFVPIAGATFSDVGSDACH